MIKSTLFYNARLLDESMDTAGALLIVDSKIRSVFQGYFTNSETASKLAHAVLAEDGIDNNCELELFDVKGYTLTPSFIDMHVHMRYPGQTAKEDLNSGLHAAVAGGLVYDRRLQQCFRLHGIVQYDVFSATGDRCNVFRRGR